MRTVEDYWEDFEHLLSCYTYPLNKYTKIWYTEII